MESDWPDVELDFCCCAKCDDNDDNANAYNFAKKQEILFNHRTANVHKLIANLAA